MKKQIAVFFGLLLILSCKSYNKTPVLPASFLQLSEIRIGEKLLSWDGAENNQIPTDKPILASFNAPLDTFYATNSVKLTHQNQEVPLRFVFLDNYKTISIIPIQKLGYFKTYNLIITPYLRGADHQTFKGFDVTFTTEPNDLKVIKISIDSIDAGNSLRIISNSKKPKTIIVFSEALDTKTITQFSVEYLKNNIPELLNIKCFDSILIIEPKNPLEHFQKYTLRLSSSIKSQTGGKFYGYNRIFYTALDTMPKFDRLSDEDLLTKVQAQTFRYFWDFAHPISGLIPERNATPETVTTGGSGFGVMVIVVGIERGFISRKMGVERLNKIVSFLTEKAERFHGVWPHWLNGATGKTVPFSSNDDGGDLVETSYMAQGLLTVRQYLNPEEPIEKSLIDQINKLLSEIEWDFYTRSNQNVLYWHWSPRVGWAMNMPIKGYNEALITYLMAASSVTHPVSAQVYHQGWTQSDHFKNGKSFYNITLPLGFDYGGPLFFAHYSFLGLDPRNLSDDYANYWEQNTAHTLINYYYCIDNPKNFLGYSSQCWGLTASDNFKGYNAHSPTEDLGVISPTAALSSFPYTPKQSMDAMKFFYYVLGDKLWGEYGFYDAFSPQEGYYGKTYLAIDQGPIIIMIENYRTGLLWRLFMSAPEIKLALQKLGFKN